MRTLQAVLLALACAHASAFDVLCATTGERPALFEGFVRPHLDAYGAERVSVLVDAERRGAPHARNTLFNRSEAAYVLFHDDDTLLHAACPQLMARALDEHPEAQFAYADFVGLVTTPAAHAYGQNFFQETPPTMSARALHARNIIDTHALVRSAAVRAVGGWDERLARHQDWDLYKRIADAHSAGNPDAVVGVKAPCEPYIKLYTDRGISSALY